MLPTMLEHDRKQAGWSGGQAAWRLGITAREYRELEADARYPDWETFDRNLQVVRLASTLAGDDGVEMSPVGR